MAKQTRPPRRSLSEPVAPSSPGLGSAALDNPVAAGGWLVMLLTGFLIVANAVLFQKGAHPSPFFSTRDRPVVEAVAQTPQQPSVADIERQKLVRDIQIELRRLGLYEGTLDGLKGPATERGVRAYQRSRGLPETGLINTALLARLAMDIAQEAETAVPGVPRLAPRSMAPQTQPTAVPLPRNNNAGTTPDPLSTRLGRVQNALAELGYGPIDVDGVMGSQTANAVRRFQLDRGLAITGEADANLVQEIERVLGRSIAG